MKNLKTYSKEQFYNRILEKLKVSKDNNDPILDIVPDEWFTDYGRLFLHFKNISALLMYFFEMEGQISDGKYENSSPRDHWEWTKRMFFTVDGNEFYTGSSRYRKPNKRYNLNEWVRTIKKILSGSDYETTWAFTIRLYDFGRLGKCLTMNELKDIAAWIQSHPKDAAAMNLSISTLSGLSHTHANKDILDNGEKEY